MAKEENFDGVLKPFQEKLTCSYCNMLFEEPTLMSCDHIFCTKCIPKNHEASVCFICKAMCKSSDLRPASYICEMIQAYKETDALIKAKNDHHLSPIDPLTRECPLVPIVEPTMSPKFSSHMSVEGLLYDDMDGDEDNDNDYVPGVETDGESDYDESSFDFDYSTSDDESSTCSVSDE